MSVEGIMSVEETRQLLKSWGLSEHAIGVLSKEPEIVAGLVSARQLEPFPKNYQPQVFEVLFDDIVYVHWEKGKKLYIAECSENYQPPFSEYAFDGQTALFLVNGEVVVNRAESMKLNVGEYLKEIAHVS